MGERTRTGAFAARCRRISATLSIPQVLVLLFAFELSGTGNEGERRERELAGRVWSDMGVRDDDGARVPGRADGAVHSADVSV